MDYGANLLHQEHIFMDIELALFSAQVLQQGDVDLDLLEKLVYLRIGIGEMGTLGSSTFLEFLPPGKGFEVSETIKRTGACKTNGVAGGLIGLVGIVLSTSLPLRNMVIDLACSGFGTEELATKC